MDTGLWWKGAHTHVRESTRRQTHRHRTHQGTCHDQQIRMGMLHPRTYLLDQREDNEGCNCVRYESRNDKNQRREHDQHPVEAVVSHLLCDGCRNGVQKAGRGDRFPEAETTSCENNNGPEEIVEVLLREDAGSEEEDDRDDRNDSHITECVLELMAHTPEDDCN